MRKDLISGKKEAIEPLTTTRWSQEYPYTYEAIKEGYAADEAMAGCVAIAGAQVMKYHNYPFAGDGIIPGYNNKPEKNIDGYEYQWEFMPSTLSSNSTTEEIIATSTLILDVGLSARSIYGGGTAADPKELAEGLVRNFRYDKNLCFFTSTTEGFGYSYAEITDLVKRDLNFGFPVIVGIAGHCIVCEGYNTKGDFYFNWGWGQSPRVGSLEDVGAIVFMLGCRPAEDEVLTGNNIISTSDSLIPGDTGVVSFKVSSHENGAYQGNIQLVLADDNNLTRSYISPVIELDVEKLESKNIEVPFNFSSGFTFGPRTLQVYYATESGYPRPLRDEEDNILTVNVNTGRPVSSTTRITGHVKAPEKVARGNEFAVSFEVVSNTDGIKDYSVLLVDSNLNQYYELGSVTAEIKADEISSLSITCLTDNVESEETYMLLVAEKDVVNNGVPFSSSILNDDNEIPLSELYVQNPTVMYGDDVKLVSNFDMSSEVYAEYYYETDVQYSISNANSGIYVIQLSLTNEDGDILSSEQYYDMEPGADIKTAHFKLTTPKIEENRVFNLHADYINLAKPDEVYYLRPKDETILNPVSINITYRNFYDYIFLSSSLRLKNGEPIKGESFQLESSMLYSLDHTDNGAFMMSVRAILEDEKGKEIEIGTLSNFVGIINQDVPFVINCVIPDKTLDGDYRLYLRATDLVGENGESRKKILSLEEGIIDELNVTLLSNMNS